MNKDGPVCPSLSLSSHFPENETFVQETVDIELSFQRPGETYSRLSPSFILLK